MWAEAEAEVAQEAMEVGGRQKGGGPRQYRSAVQEGMEVGGLPTREARDNTGGLR